MMTDILYTSRTENIGGMRCHTDYMEKKGEFTTDVPTAIGGRGEFPSPGAMLASCVASCMLSMISYKGQSHGADATGICILAAAEEGANGLVAMHFDIRVPVAVTLEQRKIMEAAALACPVGKAIRPDIAKHIHWHWA